MLGYRSPAHQELDVPPWSGLYQLHRLAAHVPPQ